MRILTKADRLLARYIPPGFIQYPSTIDKDVAIVYYKEDQYERLGSLTTRYHAVGFKGTAARPSFNYVFSKVENLNTHVLSFFDGIRAHQEIKEKRKKDVKEFCTTYKPGDILVMSWGYDQTNINFYQVIEVNGKQTITIREICAIVTNDPGLSMSGRSIPCPGVFVEDSKPMLKRVRAFETSEYVTMTSYASARKWDGTPKFCSWYG